MSLVSSDVLGKGHALAAVQRLFLARNTFWVSDDGAVWSLVGSPIIARDEQGVRYANHDGSTTNCYTTPDSAAASVTGDITILWSGELTNLAPSANNLLVDKYSAAAGGYSYAFGQYGAVAGKIYFGVSPDGTSVTNYYSSVTLGSVGVTANSRVWLYVQRVASTGVAKFYFSLNGITYAQLGISVSGVSGNIFNSTTAIGIGVRAANAALPLTGKTYRASIYAGLGIAGTPVVDFNPESYVETGGGNAQGAAWLADSAVMYAAPDGVALAGSGVGVGLLMDESRGMALGNELITNGSFSVDSGWTKSAVAPGTVTIVDGYLRLYSPANESVYAYQEILTQNKTYRVSVDVTVISGVARATIGSGGSVIPLVAGRNVFYATSITASSLFILARSSPCDIGFDNVSVKEVLGYHARQSTSASRPPRTQFAITNRNYLSVSASLGHSLSATMPNLGTDCTVFTATPGGIIKRTGVTVNGAYRITYAGSAFIGEIVVNRATTAYEDFIFSQLLGHYMPAMDELPANYWLTAMQGIYAANGGNASGGAWIPKYGPMYAAPDGATEAALSGTVGLLMDASKALALGAEIIPDGSFALGITGWIVYGLATLSWTGNSLIIDITGTAGGAAYPTPVIAGKRYACSYKAKAGTYAGSLVTTTGTVIDTSANLTDQYTTITYYFTATSTGNVNIRIQRGASSIGTVYIDDVSVREVLGYHALQSTLANRLTYIQTPTTLIPCLNSAATTQLLLATLPDLGTACTVARMTPEGLSVLTGQTIGAGAYSVNTPTDVMFGRIVVNRALTALETYIIGKLLATVQPSLSAELVTNGGFDSADGWTVTEGYGVTIADGAINFDGVTSIPNLTYLASSAALSFNIGDALYIKYVRAGGSTQGSSVDVGGSVSPIDSTNGNKAYVSVAIANTGIPAEVRVRKRSSDSVLAGTIDGISVKKVL